MLVYLLVTPKPEPLGILGCSAVAIFCIVHAAAIDLRSGVRELFSLQNAVMVGLVAYAVPILVLFTLVEIPMVLDMERASLQRAARLTYTSLAIAGIVSEILRAWGSKLHRYCFKKIASDRTRRQYYVLTLLVVIYAANFLRGDVVALLGSGNRFALSLEFETGKMWLIQYLVTGATIAFIYEHAARRVAQNSNFYYGLTIIGSFWVMYLALGNRRGLITVILATAVCLIARNLRGRRIITLLLLTFVVGGLIGVVRQGDIAALGDEPGLIGLTNFFGEFIYPGYTLVETIDKGRQPTLEFTWLSVFYKLMAAQLSGEPFNFLAHQFAIDAVPAGSDTVMGFAYLPITEAFQAFGAAGAALSGAAVLSSVLLLAYASRKRAWIYLILFSLALDINRSEFGAMVIQFSIVLIGFQATKILRI
jgi:hypothetical protein